MVNVAGLVVLIVLYLVVLVVGILAAWKIKVNKYGRRCEMSAVAGRKLNGVVGVFTMAATIVGGGYINGTAESIATNGLIWTLAPFCMFIGLIIGGVMYAGKMRERRYVTMLEPIQQKCGRVATVMVYGASLVGDVLWTASILTALGTSVSVILGVDVIISIVVSAAVAVSYTLVGQMISVAYTDVVQLNFIAIGLVLSTPFVVMDPHVNNITGSSAQWLGSVDLQQWPLWVDLAIAMSLGTIPWQAYFQRVLSVKSSTQARVLSVMGALFALVLVIPPVIIGMVGVSADWSNTTLGLSPVALNRSSILLPVVLYEFTPPYISIIGLGAISAAVMSSVDSAILASSSLFTHNVYKTTIRPQSTDRELMWTQRLMILVVGATSTAVSLLYTSVYDLFVLAADLVFVTVLPQLTCALYIATMNAYGSIAGFLCGLLMRLGAGEPHIGLPAFIRYPFYENHEQLFPFRTFSMLMSVAVIILVSLVMKYLFVKGYLPQRADLFHINTVQYEVTTNGKDHDRHDDGADLNHRPFSNSYLYTTNL